MPVPAQEGERTENTNNKNEQVVLDEECEMEDSFIDKAISDILKVQENYVVKTVAIGLVAAISMFTADSNYSRLLGVLTLYIGLAFDVMAADFNKIEKQHHKWCVIYTIFTYTVIAISLLLVVLSRNDDFLSLVHSHHVWCRILLELVAFAGVISPLFEWYVYLS